MICVGGFLMAQLICISGHKRHGTIHHKWAASGAGLMLISENKRHGVELCTEVQVALDLSVVVGC